MSNPLRTVWSGTRQHGVLNRPLLSLSLVLGLHITGWAQTAPDAGSLLQQLERERKPILPPKALPSRPAEPAALQPLSGASVTVSSFRFVGNTLLSAGQLAPAVAEYLNRPLDFTQLQGASAAVLMPASLGLALPSTRQARRPRASGRPQCGQNARGPPACDGGSPRTRA